MLRHRSSFTSNSWESVRAGGCGAATSETIATIDGPLSKEPCGGTDGVTAYGGILPGPSDPRHRTWGECKGQGVVSNGVAVWQGGCTWKNADGDAFWVFWSAKPGDTGSEPHAPANAPKGTAVIKGATGKMQSLIGKTTKWTGLPNGGGSYFCDDE